MFHASRIGLCLSPVLLGACFAAAPSDDAFPPDLGEAALRQRSDNLCEVVRCRAGFSCQVSDGNAVCVPEAFEPKVECKTDDDCGLAADYCGGCNCLALGPGESVPECPGEEVACLVWPCLELSARCEAGQCTLGTATF